VFGNLARVQRLIEIFPVIDCSSSVMACFGLVKAQLSRQDITVDDFDLLIGSTAITLGYTLVTNKQKHFSKIPDLKLANWSK